MERMDREYMPLDGEEIVQVIERMIGRKLRGYEHFFGRHLVRHNPLIRVAIKVDCFTPEQTPTDGGFELAFPLFEGPIMEPDRVREEVGIGTYETKLVDEPSGTLADVKVGQREMLPTLLQADIDKTIQKVTKLLGDSEKKPTPKAKPKRGKKGKGWPRGKKRGPKNPPALEAGNNNDTPLDDSGIEAARSQTPDVSQTTAINKDTVEV